MLQKFCPFVTVWLAQRIHKTNEIQEIFYKWLREFTKPLKIRKYLVFVMAQRIHKTNEIQEILDICNGSENSQNQ